ncbi:hypothetical protein BUMB_03387 [Candidatus Paraburkholderia calva]|nr:hypothetical protein BUMB_03387 [Candidatus Paraburkholderia calva]
MKNRMTAIPTVYVVTAHGRQPLEAVGDERLFEILDRYHVPWSAVSIYTVPTDGGAPQLRASLDKRLSELSDVSDILLYFNRNVNPFMFNIAQFSTQNQAGEHASTEYFYQRLDNKRSVSDVFLKKMTEEECKDVIAQRVADVIRENLPPGSDLVVGVSGGGDSNALLHALSRLEAMKLKIRPVIIKGIPDWDKGVPRAQELCSRYGLDLTIVEDVEVQKILGIGNYSTSLITRFEREFAGDDFEFLGTLLVRLALIRHAEALDTPYICTGLNLEDVLCEALFRTTNGQGPAGIPVRSIGEYRLLFPLWLCPKRIIDGCFPEQSLDNYEARYPCFSLGRNLYYSIIYELQSRFPAFIEQLAHGYAEQSCRNPVVYPYDEQLGFHVERFVPFPLRQKFERMLRDVGVPA